MVSLHLEEIYGEQWIVVSQQFGTLSGNDIKNTQVVSVQLCL